MKKKMKNGDLFVVATPIGNLGDLTHRAVEVLTDVDIIAAEDTRRTRVLLDHYAINTPMMAVHEHNEESVAPKLVGKLCAGQSVALVSDAGTPLVSDPGFRLINEAISKGIAVHPLPGASAVTAALSVSGLATDHFCFQGFLPSKKSARLTQLEGLRQESHTLIFFESSHRIVSSLKAMKNVFGDSRQAAVCREMTKTFETILRGGLGKLVSSVESDSNQQKGEFVVVVAGADSDVDADMLDAREMSMALREYLSDSQAARVAAKLCGVDRRTVYQWLSEFSAKNSP